MSRISIQNTPRSSPTEVFKAGDFYIDSERELCMCLQDHTHRQGPAFLYFEPKPFVHTPLKDGDWLKYHPAKVTIKARYR